ncbi:MAG TPA: GlsB/YeaQ/YmgE family stress response membrane protein [Candidatus Saccharimonadales bacterium]|nr:GlsB/YeaQ/YmgE family stress response membrane protein [Candidatus Saccharimonadales bacterium]
MGWIGWIVLGALAGWIAKMITKEEGGLLKNIILGIIGGVVGGGIVQILGGSGVNGFNIYSFIVAVLGAILVIYIARTIKK